MKAFLKSYRQSPRKVRLIADHVRGKNVADVLTELNFIAKRAADTVKKLVQSAVANSGKDANTLVIKEILINEGPTMKRSLPRARGMATRINKRTSHISITLAEVTKK
jgi:large subunit ribosomal protein L22